MQDALNEAARLYQRPLVAWLHLRFASRLPWREARLLVKPLGQEVYALASVAEDHSEVLILPAEQRDLAEEWQRAIYDALGSAWLTAGVIITTLPGGRAHVETHYNYDKDPGTWSESDPPFTGEDVAYHLARFPRRTGAAIPAWMRERIVAAGLPDPGATVEGTP